MGWNQKLLFILFDSFENLPPNTRPTLPPLSGPTPNLASPTPTALP